MLINLICNVGFSCIILKKNYPNYLWKKQQYFCTFLALLRLARELLHKSTFLQHITSRKVPDLTMDDPRFNSPRLLHLEDHQFDTLRYLKK